MNTNTLKSQAQNSLVGVLWNKFVEFVEEKPLGSIIRFLAMSFLAGVLSSILTAPDAMQEVFYRLMMWRHSVIPAVVMCFAFVFFAPKLWGMFFEQVVQIVEFFSDQSIESDETIEGVPVNELIDHLFENQSFKRCDIEGTFGMPHNRFQRLAEKMEEMEILTRGENNSRVLNTKMTRAEVIEHLKGKRVAMQLEYPLNIVRTSLPCPTTFTSRKI